MIRNEPGEVEEGAGWVIGSQRYDREYEGS
jgi:hypothetical protein